MRSMTSTRGVTRVGCGRGTTIEPWPARSRTMATSSMFSASRRKSSSSTMVSANSSMTAGRLTILRMSMRRVEDAGPARPSRRCPGSHEPIDLRALDLDRDLLPVGRTPCGPGRWTPRRRLAVEVGEDLPEVAFRRSSLDRLAAPPRRARPPPDPGGRSNSVTSSSGRIPWAEEMTCPSLMYVGPRCSNDRRRRREMSWRDSAPPRRRAPSAQGRTATARTTAVRASRRRGGSRRRRRSTGTRSWTARRVASSPRRHTRAVGSTIHGPSAENARSSAGASGPSGGTPFGRLPLVGRCGHGIVHGRRGRRSPSSGYGVAARPVSPPVSPPVWPAPGRRAPAATPATVGGSIGYLSARRTTVCRSTGGLSCACHRWTIRPPCPGPSVTPPAPGGTGRSS